MRLYAEAAEGAKRGTEQGDPFAEYTLGELYLCGGTGGIRLPKDDRLAFSLLMKAAQQGLPQAQSQLGYLLGGENGRGVAKDPSQARLWYTKAAEAGLVEAQAELAIFLENSGEKEQAIFWYKKSALLGSQSSSYFLKKHYGLIVGDCSAMESQTPATQFNASEDQFTKGVMALALVGLLFSNHSGHAPAPDPQAVMDAQQRDFEKGQYQVEKQTELGSYITALFPFRRRALKRCHRTKRQVTRFN